MQCSGNVDYQPRKYHPVNTLCWIGFLLLRLVKFMDESVGGKIKHTIRKHINGLHFDI